MEVKELYDICRQLAGEEPSATATHRMHELLVLCCSEGCRREGGTFGGLFAQVDFLCKRYGIANEEKREVQTMRRHSNSYDPANDQEWTYDLRALALKHPSDIVIPLVEKIPKENRAGFPLVAFSPVFPDGKTGRRPRRAPARRGRPRGSGGESHSKNGIMEYSGYYFEKR